MEGKLDPVCCSLSTHDKYLGYMHDACCFSEAVRCNAKEHCDIERISICKLRFQLPNGPQMQDHQHEMLRDFECMQYGMSTVEEHEGSSIIGCWLTLASSLLLST